MMLGDGLFQLLLIPFKAMRNLRRKQQQLAGSTNTFRSVDAIRLTVLVLSFDDRRRTHIFLKDNIPFFYAIIGYTILAIISTIAMTPPVAGSPPVYGQRRATPVKARRERGQRDVVAAGLVGFMLARGNHKWGPAVSHTHEGWVVRWAFSPKWPRPTCDL
ncbi:putative metal-nicotianamine transporter YSL18 [Panicum miliaceum]|uniref:Metal-nicotianamine transporter YSL18 n=1 Tax=Panicum miliaceum TaxID=4540 RepID=A0A3L6QHQ1_PANMI|nr:putative metal-nicotianamine transporter YSL18 [Panicum miliaceum]